MSTYQSDANASADNAVHLPVVFCDIDFRASSEAEARKRLGDFLFPPSIIWNSGGGLHCLWLLREPIGLRDRTEVDQAASLLRRLAAHLGADLAAAEPNRVLRVVKTFNHKPEYQPAKRVEVEVFEPSRTYNPDEFDQILPAEAIETMPGTKLVIPATVDKYRNRLLFRQGRALKRQGLPSGAIRAALVTTNLECCKPPLSDAEVQKIFTSVMKTPDRARFKAAESPLFEAAAPDAPPAPAAHAADAPPPEPADVVDLSALLDETATYFRRFVVVDDHQAATLALWTGHTYTFQAVDITPYLSITSATKRAGKSLLRECISRVVLAPWKTSRVSPAALLRKVDKLRPTLLLDEVDQAMKARGGDFTEALVALLNAGFEKEGVASLCQGDAHAVVDFHVYCPKALCGIGALPDTVMDRSIVIRLRRRMRTERTERGRLLAVRAAGTPLQRRWGTWGPQALLRLTGAVPALPAALDDRQQDCWESLLAIADLAGGDWPARARAAAVALSVNREDEDHAVQLLHDMRGVMEAAAVRDPRGASYDVIASTALLAQLNKLVESPWPTWTRGGEMSAHAMAAMLRGFELRSRKHRIGEATKRGYTRHELQEVFSRYLPTPLETPEQAVRAEQTNSDGGGSVPLRDFVPLRSGTDDVAPTTTTPPTGSSPHRSVPEQNGKAEQNTPTETGTDPHVPDVPDFTGYRRPESEDRDELQLTAATAPSTRTH
jgi:hypothetical protein